MVTHPLLAAAPPETGFFALDFLVYGKAVEQHLRLTPRNMRFSKNRGVGGPRQRHGGVVYVVEPVAVAEAVLRQNHMPPLLPQHTDEHAPAFGGNVDAA